MSLPKMTVFLCLLKPSLKTNFVVVSSLVTSWMRRGHDQDLLANFICYFFNKKINNAENFDSLNNNIFLSFIIIQIRVIERMQITFTTV